MKGCVKMKRYKLLREKIIRFLSKGNRIAIRYVVQLSTISFLRVYTFVVGFLILLQTRITLKHGNNIDFFKTDVRLEIT